MDRQWMGNGWAPCDAMRLERSKELIWTGQVGAGRSFAAGRESSPGAQLAHLARSSTPILQFNDVLRTFCFNLRSERMREFLQRE